MILASVVATVALRRYLGWRRELARASPVFGEIAQTLGALQARRGTRSASDLPESGSLEARGLASAGPEAGRLVGVDLLLTLPAHVALLGATSGARTFASVLGGQVLSTAGSVTLAGIDLAAADPGRRAHRLAFAGGDTYLFPGTLRANLLYGCTEASPAETGSRLLDAVTVAGLRPLVAERGLSASLDPTRRPGLAAAVVQARRAVRAALDREGLAELVVPFDPASYNPHATVGENLLFGVALGDTFREDRLPSQPFVKSLLDAEDLTKPLAGLGAAVARQTLDMFAGLPDATRLGRFALVSVAERDGFEHLLQRRAEKARGAGAARDAERLIGLALRYSESRHRFGLVGPELQARILRMRTTLARTLPTSLRPAIEFFDPDRVCAAASVRDNLLFGRVAQDRAGAERDVMATMRTVLATTGLEAEIDDLGLDTRLDPVEPGLTAPEEAAIDLVRCLVRAPSTLVVERALEGLPSDDAAALVRRLAGTLAGRGLLLVVPDGLEDAVAGIVPDRVRFEHGRVAPAAVPGAST